MQRDPRIRVVVNPDGTTPAGLNAALASTRGEVIVRMDVHTVYADDYIAQCVAVLDASAATCVGGAWYAQGEGPAGRAIAAAFNSGFGSGGARSRNRSYTGSVDTVYLGAWRRADLLAVGGFDPALVRNQDDELNLRTIRSGGRVWQSARIRSTYQPRRSFRALLWQYFQYGYWKVAVFRKHRMPASWRHLAPAGFVVSILVGLLIAPFVPWMGLVVAAVVGTYIIVCLATAAYVARRDGESQLTLVAVAFVTMQMGYGLGFVLGLLDAFRAGKAARNSVRRLTR